MARGNLRIEPGRERLGASTLSREEGVALSARLAVYPCHVEADDPCGHLARSHGVQGVAGSNPAVPMAQGRTQPGGPTPELAATVNFERFQREIQLAARLQHPHIVPLLSAGVTDGLPYYTMPLVEGETLRAKLARQGELPIGETLRILRDVTSALVCAHENGVVHRDIKPGNVLVSKHGAVVTNFGVAKALSASASPTMSRAMLPARCRSRGLADAMTREWSSAVVSRGPPTERRSSPGYTRSLAARIPHWFGPGGRAIRWGCGILSWPRFETTPGSQFCCGSWGWSGSEMTRLTAQRYLAGQSPRPPLPRSGYGEATVVNLQVVEWSKPSYPLRVR